MKKVLVIDDSLTSRMFIKKGLLMVSAELSVLEAKNGVEAMTVLEKNSGIDVIISDVNMPEMSGFTFIRNVKNDPRFSSIPIVFVTSLANDGRIDNLLTLGAFEVIKKPIDISVLTNVLGKLQTLPNNKNEGWG